MQVKAECYNIGESVWIHVGVIDDSGYSFASPTYRVISIEEDKFAYGLY